MLRFRTMNDAEGAMTDAACCPPRRNDCRIWS
jgi:hypothetical protein